LYDIEWPGPAVIHFYTVSGSSKNTRTYGSAERAVLESLRPVAIDRFASALERFLDDRIAGAGAEEWLSEKAASVLHEIGLYAIGEPGEPNTRDLDVWGVEATVPKGSTTAVYISVSSGGASQAERLLLGPGLNQFRRHRDAVVLEADLMQKAGTS
jgi:hypothetical protein